MKQESHRRLARYLLGLTPQIKRRPICCRAFLIGCSLPDYNLFTYLRGFPRSVGVWGHSRPYSERICLQTLARLRKSGVQRVRDFYALGALVHYLADSFTHPHTQAFKGGLRLHNAYERALRTCFPACIRAAKRKRLPSPPTDPEAFLRTAYAAYERHKPDPRNDGRFVLFVCGMICLSILKENNHKSVQNQIKTTEISKNE